MGIPGIELYKTIVIFEIKLVEFQNSGRKMAYLGIFGPQFSKSIVAFDIRTSNLSSCNIL